MAALGRAAGWRRGRRRIRGKRLRGIEALKSQGLRPHYARVEQEGRTLLHEIFAAAGDIRVCDTELRITRAPLSSPHRTRAAQALCDILDQTATIYPGSRLRLRFAVRPLPRISLAFPGSPAQHSAAPVLDSAP